MATILILILFIAIFIFCLWYNSATQKGKRGENKVATILEDLSDEYSIFNDVVLPTNNGTTQIDHIVVSKYGIFAIETKNYTGDIYGSDNRDNWTQIIVTEVWYKRNPFKTYTYVTKNKFYNPVKQALGHVYWLKKLLKEYKYLPVVPIVVFVGDAYLKKVYSQQIVIYEDELLSSIEKYKTTYLSNDEVEKVIAKIQLANQREEIKNGQHIKNIKLSRKVVREPMDPDICPECGGRLVERKGAYGMFYGCSNYPKCKYTTKQK